MNTDNIDLIYLGAGWAQGAGEHSHRLSTRWADELEEAALMLHRLWQEIPSADWCACWAYEVAEPLGVWYGEQFKKNHEAEAQDIYGNVVLPPLHEAELRARDLIALAMTK